MCKLNKQLLIYLEYTTKFCDIYNFVNIVYFCADTANGLQALP